MTAQFPEALIFDHKEHAMCAEPLGVYLQLMGIAKLFRARHTACSRGYMGTWEILGRRLYLIGLKGNLKLGGSANLETLFPGFPDRVFAHWFSGTLRIPQGKLLEYVHGGYGSRYERDLFLVLEAGVLQSQRTKVNGKAQDPDATEGYAIGDITTLGGG